MWDAPVQISIPHMEKQNVKSLVRNCAVNNLYFHSLLESFCWCFVWQHHNMWIYCNSIHNIVRIVACGNRYLLMFLVHCSVSGIYNTSRTANNICYRWKKGNVFPVHTVKAYRGSRVTAPLICNLGTRRGEWTASRLNPLPMGKNPSTHWLGGWVGLRAGLNIFEKRKPLAPIRIWTPDCPIIWSLPVKHTYYYCT